MTEQEKKQIDEMSYKDMLSLWRFTPCGHPLFQGDTGDYYAQVMGGKRVAIGNDACVSASKSLEEM